MKFAHCLPLFGVVLPLTLYAQDPGPISGATATLIEAQGEDFNARDRASHALGRRLPTADVEALLGFLVRKPGVDHTSPDELASLKNNAADALLAQPELPAALLRVFETAFADADQGEIWREYVVQKIPEFVKLAAGEERERGLEFLRERLADTSYIYAGTALLGMQRLHEHSAELVAGREVAQAARRILHGGGHATASKLSALQILARHEREEARTLARIWLTDDMPVMLRVSAIATLGEVGEAADRVSLSRYASSPELRLRTAARSALAKLGSE